MNRVRHTAHASQQTTFLICMLSVATRNDEPTRGSIPNYASPDLWQVFTNQLHNLQ